MSTNVTPIIETLISALRENFIAGERQADIIFAVAVAALTGDYDIDESAIKGRSDWIDLALARARQQAEILREWDQKEGEAEKGQGEPPARRPGRSGRGEAR